MPDHLHWRDLISLLHLRRLGPTQAQPGSRPASWGPRANCQTLVCPGAPHQSPTQVPLLRLPLVSKPYVSVSLYSVKGVSTLSRFKKRNLLGHIMNHWKLRNERLMYIPRRQRTLFCIKDFCLWKETHVSEMESPGEGAREVPGGPLRTGLTFHTIL